MAPSTRCNLPTLSLSLSLIGMAWPQTRIVQSIPPYLDCASILCAMCAPASLFNAVRTEDSFSISASSSHCLARLRRCR
eukprot:5901509-Amphidinium_carterae.1